ncbi:unnamed protein product, partial [marine sediment metagenome]
TGGHKTVDAVVVVSADEATQIQRIQARDGLGEIDAKHRIASQLPLADKVREADYVIVNDSTEEALKTSVQELHKTFLERFV